MSHADRPSQRSEHTVNNVLENADTMSTEELDKLPYGMIQLDATGRILNYNAMESKLAVLLRARGLSAGVP